MTNQDDDELQEHVMWRDNGFAYHLISELLGGAFVGVDARVVGQALLDNAGALAPTARHLLALERKHRQQHQQLPGQAEVQTDARAEGGDDDDDLFAFVSMGDDDEADDKPGGGSKDDDASNACGGDGDDEEACEDEASEALERSLAQVKDASALPRTVESFLAAEPLHRAATFSSSFAGAASSSLHEVRLALFDDMERLHQEGTPEALLVVEQFLVSLSNFVAKKEPRSSSSSSEADAVIVHPFLFKRLLLTGLPAASSLLLPHPPTEDDLLLDETGGQQPQQADCRLFRMLLVLAFSFSDETRFHAVELLLMLALVPAHRSRTRSLVERPSLLQVKTNALAIYDTAYSVDRWAPALGSHTFRTLTFPMLIREAEALVHHYQALYLGTQLQSEHKRVVGELEEKLQAVIHSPEFGGRAFVKISTRSPKDVVFLLAKFEPTLSQVTEEWMALHGLTEPLPESVTQAMMQRCGALCLSVTSGAEAVDMLKTSKRIWVDLKEALETPSNDFAMKLVVREWLDIPNEFELRGFVRNRRLTALSQYFSKCYFPWVSPAQWASVKARVLSYFETTVASLLPVEDCVCDFVVCNDERVLVIELNLFGRTAGAALFSWDADQQLLYGNRPFEFRVIADATLSITVVV